MEEKKDTININGKVIGAIVILLLLVVSTFGMFFLNGRTTGASLDNKYSNLPEKCRPPAGQDIAAWKEHLGHHTETQECLKYFN